MNKAKGNMYPGVSDTRNPVKGKCSHGCSYCYMNKLYKRRLIKPQEIYLDVKELGANLGKGKFIFIGNSCDMWADGVPDLFIYETLKQAKKFPENKYLFQSKKPIRFLQFADILPQNCCIGATIETNRIYPCMGNTPSPIDRGDAIDVLRKYERFITKDRFCKSHEYLFMFSKNTRYYFNLENALEPAKSAVRPWTKGYKTKTGRTGLTPQQHGGGARQYKDGNAVRLRRDVWTVPSVTSSEEHYAMFPEKLIAPCISCGCPENGIVLDPFMGSGTTAVASLKLFRNYIGCEINPDYIKIAERQIAAEKGLFNTLEAAG